MTTTTTTTTKTTGIVIPEVPTFADVWKGILHLQQIMEQNAQENRQRAEEFAKEFEKRAKERAEENERLVREAEKRAKERAEELEKRSKERAEENERLAQEAEKRSKERAEENERLAQEAEKRSKERAEESEKRSKEFEKRSKELDRRLGALGNRLGDFVQEMVKPAAVRLFQERNLPVHQVIANQVAYDDHRQFVMEIDLIVINTDVLIAIECKSHLSHDDVQEHLERLEIFKHHFPQYRDYKILGAVAGMVIPSEVARYAHKKGLYVLAQSGEAVEIRNPSGFEAREW